MSESWRDMRNNGIKIEALVHTVEGRAEAELLKDACWWLT